MHCKLPSRFPQVHPVGLATSAAVIVCMQPYSRKWDCAEDDRSWMREYVYLHTISQIGCRLWHSSSLPGSRLDAVDAIGGNPHRRCAITTPARGGGRLGSSA